MNHYIVPVTLIMIVLFQSCTGTCRFGTTMERDENNICQTNMVIQIGIEGTDADVEAEEVHWTAVLPRVFYFLSLRQDQRL